MFELRTLPKAADIKRILVIKWSAMGDLAMAGAAFEDIVHTYPHARIDLDTLPPWDKLYRDDPRFEVVHCFNLRQGGAREQWRWLRAIGALGYDLVIDLQTTDRSRIALGLLGLLGKAIPYRAGNNRAWPYNLPIVSTPAPVRSASQIARDTLRSAGVTPLCEYPHLHTPGELEKKSSERLAQHGLRQDRFVAFLPGCQAAGYLKRWGEQNYIDLAHSLLKRDIDNVIILGGPDEYEVCQRIASGVGENAINLCAETELLELPLICKQALFTVANDTGTAHLASAANRPLLVVCGPTDPRRVLPAGPLVRGIQLNLPCINCYRKHCAHHSCMRLLTPTQVLARLEMMVPRIRQAGHNAL